MSESIKNVCFFVGTHGDWGGASRIVFNILRNLERDKIEPIVMLTSEGEICKELGKLGIKYKIWPHEKSFALLSHFNHLIKCIRFYRKNHIDIIVTSYGCLGWRPAELLAAKLANIPIIQHCQQIISEPSPYTKYSNLILTCSNFVLEKSLFGDVPAESLYDIVDIDKFGSGNSIRRELGLDNTQIVITYLGRRRKSKGLGVFVSLTKELKQDNLCFLIAVQKTGQPNEDTYSNDEFDALLKEDGRIRHLDYRTDVENIYAASDVIVLPSQGEEPCPAVILESAASGTPIVATDTGATNELIQHEKTGYLVAKNDFSAMCEYINKLAVSSSLREAIGNNAKEYAQYNFYKEPIQKVLDIYEKIT